MKTVCYWFKIQNTANNTNFKKLQKLLRDRPFSHNQEDSGFLIDSQDEHEFLCQYVLKESFLEKLEDPFGTLVEVPRISFYTVMFKVYRDPLVVEIVNPGKNAKRLLSVLNATWQTNLSILKPKVHELLDKIETKFSKMEVTSIETKDFLINSRTNCFINFSSLVDVRKDVNHFLKNRDFKFMRAKARFAYDCDNYVVEINESGRFILNFDVFDARHLKVKETIFEFIASQ